MLEFVRLDRLDGGLLLLSVSSSFFKRACMHSLAWWPTLIAVVVATVTDLRSRKIPNWLTLPFLLAGLVVSVWTGGLHGLEKSLAGLAVGVAFFAVLCLMGGMGMGDVKLCAAIGAWIGPSQMVIALVVTGIVGGVMALCWAIFGGFLGEMLNGTGDLLLGWKERGYRTNPALSLSNPSARKLPYAPAIAIGTLASFFSK
jgi:prepilin peptidase CpaA